MLFKKRRAEKARLLAEKTASDLEIVAEVEQRFERIKAGTDESEKLLALLELRWEYLSQLQPREQAIRDKASKKKRTLLNTKFFGGTTLLLGGSLLSALLFPPALALTVPGGLYGMVAAGELSAKTKKKLMQIYADDPLFSGLAVLDQKLMTICEPLIRTCDIDALVTKAGDSRDSVFQYYPQLRERFIKAAARKLPHENPATPAPYADTAAERIEKYKKLKLGKR